MENGRESNKNRFISAKQYSHLSDSDIIQKILSGATPFFEVLMRRYNQRLFRIQRSYISDEEAIKDTLQLTYLKAYENLDSFRGDAKFSTWITRIAINEALKYINRQKRYVDLPMENENELTNEHTVDTNGTPEDDAIQHDFKQLLEEVVGSLSPKYRSVYVMREIEHMSTRETAECLDISRANVKVRLHRAKQMLQEKLERKVADTEIFDFLGARCDQLVFNVMQQIEAQDKTNNL